MRVCTSAGEQYLPTVAILYSKSKSQGLAGGELKLLYMVLRRFHQPNIACPYKGWALL